MLTWQSNCIIANYNQNLFVQVCNLAFFKVIDRGMFHNNIVFTSASNYFVLCNEMQ